MCIRDSCICFCAMHGKNVLSIQMLEVSLLGVGAVLRLERDTRSTVKWQRQATNEYLPPAARECLANVFDVRVSGLYRFWDVAGSSTAVYDWAQLRENRWYSALRPHDIIIPRSFHTSDRSNRSNRSWCRSSSSPPAVLWEVVQDLHSTFPTQETCDRSLQIIRTPPCNMS